MPRVLQSLIQATAGSSEHGNFEAVIVNGGSLVHWFREHLTDDRRWDTGATIVPTGVAGPGCIIQSNFGTGEVRNFEVVVPVRQDGRTASGLLSRQRRADAVGAGRTRHR